jgi:Terpene cyclase DEP1
VKAKHLYLLLCILGTALPLSQFVPWVADHGLDLRLFTAELFATRIGAFFGLDVAVTAIVLWVLVATEGRRADVRHRWAPVVATLAVGVSLGLPLFLYLRESRLDAYTSTEGRP